MLTILNTLQVLRPVELVVPLGFLLTGAAVVWSIMRDQLISVVPVARDLLIEQMDDGMLVLDEADRLIDLNPAMESLLGIPRAG